MSVFNLHTCLRNALTVMALLFSLTLAAQDFSQAAPVKGVPWQPQYFGAAGITVGIAIPLNQFREENVFSEASGYADSGFYIQPVNVLYRFTKFYGLNVSWSRASMPFDATALANGLSRAVPNVGYTATAENWLIDNISIGLTATVPSKYFDLDFKIMGSVLRSTMPEVDLLASSNGATPIGIKQLESVSLDLGYTIGLVGRVHVYKSLDWFIQAEYYHAKADYDIDFEYSFGGTEEDEFSVPIYMLQVGTGIGLRF